MEHEVTEKRKFTHSRETSDSYTELLPFSTDVTARITSECTIVTELRVVMDGSINLGQRSTNERSSVSQ